jgi:UDP-N-acetylmuramoyl-tripeptide--D-alanyl-D-alanine ligase
MATPIPSNCAPFSLDEVLSATGGMLLSPGDPKGSVTGVSTDTRAPMAGAAFVALAGDHFDAHAHLPAARAGGAALAIVEREVSAPPGLGIVRVASTLDALGALARAHARRWRAQGGDRRVIGITGSAGKTTTRVAVEALVSAIRPGAVLATSGNLNNRIGMPMMMLALGPEHRIAVLEMGMNRPGEIEKLAGIAEPDVGVLTLVAAAHTELLGSVEAVAIEKGALLRALRRDGVAIFNADDHRVRSLVEASPSERRHGYGRSERSDVRILSRETLSMTRSKVRLARARGDAFEFTTPLLGEAGALACAAAVAVAELALDARVDGPKATAAFESAQVGGGAGRLVPRCFSDGLAVIDDSYNANPASMRASIATAAELAAVTGRGLVLVLGEMRELGAGAAAGHDEVGVAAATSGARALVAIGGDAARIAARAGEGGLHARYFEDVRSARDEVLALVSPADLVLVKGSRGVATEEIVTALREDHDGGERGER